MFLSFSLHAQSQWQRKYRCHIYKFVFLVSLLLCLAVPALAQFKQLHIETNENNHVNGVDFYSGGEGYIAFSKTLGFTTDSGKTITYKPITVNNVNFNGYGVNLTFGFELSGVKAFDRNKVLIYGNYGLVPAILYSANGGSTYKVVYHSQFKQVPDSYITDMAFTANNLIGFAVDKHRILKTTDGGLSWSASFTFENIGFTKIQVLSDQVVHAYNTDWQELSPHYSTIDGGNTWQIIPTNYGVNSIYFVNANVAWSNTKNGKLLISTDGGNNWTKQNDEVLAPVSFSKMIVVNDSTAYAIQTDGFDVFKTSNKGKIWERLHRDNNYSYTGYSLNDIQIKGNAIWVGGGHGYLALSGNSGGTVIPHAYFTMDETGAESAGIVKLNNYSKSGNTYKWLVNGKVIANTYNASYPIDLYGFNDTVQLVVTNKRYSDTLTKVTTFSQAVKITDILPDAAVAGQRVSINGEHFKNIKSVSFGGVPAISFEVNIYGDNITAVVGKGATGNVKVATAKTSATFAGFTYIPPPKILSFSPAVAIKGDTVVIKGTGFDWINKVQFNNVDAKLTLISKSEIRAVIPFGNVTGRIVVKSDYNGADTSANVFKLKPVIKSVDNNNGRYNGAVVISGIGFFDVKSVTLDGNPVLSFNPSTDYWYDDKIYVQLGEGGKEGKFVVTMNNGLSAVYNGFKYHFTPVITSFAPVLASPGTQVTITGNNFSTVAAENFVYFGAVKATVISATATTLVVKVPAGATYSPLTVATTYATTTSVRYFTPTFSGGSMLTAASFGAQTSTPSGGNSRSLVVVDYNSDGKPDIAVSAFAAGGNVTVFNENKSIAGNISFERTQSVYISNGESTQTGAVHLAVADWDLDGDLDVILAGLYEKKPAYMKSIYYPNGIYSTPHDITTVPGWEADFFRDDRYVPTGIGVSDMDGDGQLDYILAGRFTQKPFLPNITLADIDGDGKADVLVHIADTLGVYRNISTKNNITYAPRVDFLTGGTINGVSVGDFDNDGKTDIAMTMKNAPGIAIWKNSSTTGNIALGKVASMSTSAVPTTIAFADINGDGKVDIGVSVNDKVLLYQSKTGATISFEQPVTINLPATTDLAFADLDGDARPEIIGLNDPNVESGIYIMRNLTGGPQITSFSPEGGPAGTSVEITGTGLTGSTAVTLGGTAVRSFKVNSNKSITAVVGDGSRGYIALDGPAGPGTSLSEFHFLSKPAMYMGSYLTNDATISLGDSIALVATPYDEKFKVQWYKDGRAITGATNPYLKVKASGSYTISESYNSDVLTSDAGRVRVVLSLPADNFRISATSVTCKGGTNGAIAIHAGSAADYTATISGLPIRTTKFRSDAKFENLPAGSYKVCISVDSYPEYEQCFDVLVKEPKDLWAYATVNKVNNTVSLELDGADIYNITINSNTYTVAGNTTLPLDKGFNKLAISTDKLCQGIIEKLIDLSDIIVPYPNPVNEVLNINLDSHKATNASISITTASGGRVLYSKEVANPYGILHVNMAGYRQGVYLLRLKLDNQENVYKIIKQ